MTSASKFQELFNSQSSEYAKFRPTYPEALFQYLASLTDEHEQAWDCGTGNGQAALELARYYSRVLATDPSQRQLDSATPHPSVEYRLGTAEQVTFSSGSVDLVTVAQAFHWFDARQFFSEATRVLKPKGVLAIWCYGLCTITPAVDLVVQKLYEDVLGKYWEDRRKMVEDGYAGVVLPGQAIRPPQFEIRLDWEFAHLIGYLGTWSALQTYVKKHGRNPIEDLLPEFEAAWGQEHTHTALWPLSLLISRKA